MNYNQQRFLENVGRLIPILLQCIADGNTIAEIKLGVRRINGKMVHLKLVAAVIDTGINSLSTHSKARAESKDERP